jgi:hypothetical protein
MDRDKALFGPALPETTEEQKFVPHVWLKSENSGFLYIQGSPPHCQQGFGGI